MKQAEEFKAFLKKHRITSAFSKNLKEFKSKTLNKFIKEVSPNSFITGAFTWVKTEQGHEYWSKLNQEWFKLLKQK